MPRPSDPEQRFATVALAAHTRCLVCASEMHVAGRKEAPCPWTRIPDWYHFGMSKQIAVRLPDDLVEFVDEVVGSGQEGSRAAVVTRALERERRRMIASRDAQILANAGPDPELDGLAGYAAGVRVEG